MTLHTPMPLIELALEGRYAYMRAINGIPDEPDPAVPKIDGGPIELMAYLRRRAKG